MKRFSIAGSAIVLLLIVVVIVIVIQKGYIGVSYEQQIRAAISTTSELDVVCRFKSGEVTGVKVLIAATDQDGDGQQDTFLVLPGGQSIKEAFSIYAGNFRIRDIDFSPISFIPGISGAAEIGIGSIIETILLHNIFAIGLKIDIGFPEILDILSSRGESSIAFKGKEEQLNRQLDEEDLLFGELDKLYTLLGFETPVTCKSLGIEDVTSDKVTPRAAPVGGDSGDGGGGSDTNGDTGDGTAVCGDLVCSTGEELTCPIDCGEQPSPAVGFCGDSICDSLIDENYITCAADCVSPTSFY